jgi:hypothetical protein
MEPLVARITTADGKWPLAFGGWRRGSPPYKEQVTLMALVPTSYKTGGGSCVGFPSHVVWQGGGGMVLEQAWPPPAPLRVPKSGNPAERLPCRFLYGAGARAGSVACSLGAYNSVATRSSMLACGTKYSAEEGIRKIDVRAGISGAWELPGIPGMAPVALRLVRLRQLAFLAPRP